MKNFKKVLYEYGYLSGFVGVVTFVFSTILAFLLFPPAEYDIYAQTLSKLGAHPEYGFVFNLGIIVSGCLFFFFSLSLHSYLKDTNQQLAMFRLIISVVNCVALVSIGIFPDELQSYQGAAYVPLNVVIHVIAASIFFLGCSITAGIVSYEFYLLRKDEDRNLSTQVTVGVITIVTNLMFWTISYIWLMTNYLYVLVILLQKITILAFLVWITVLSWWLKESF